jgi:hypothetical protein
MKNEDIKKAIETSYKHTSEGFLINHDILINKIQELSKKELISEYQLCPKCLGEGRIYSGYLSSSIQAVCDVCNGSKILIKPVITNE